MRGAWRGSVPFRPTLPRLNGRSTSTWQEMPWPVCSLRAWSSTMASTNTSCRSGTSTSGAERTKAPAVANGVVTLPERWLRHSSAAAAMRAAPRADTPKVSALLGTRQVCT